MSGDEGERRLVDELRPVMLMHRAEVRAANEQAATWARVWREEVIAHGQHGRPTERYKRGFRCVARKRARAAHRAYDAALSRWRNEVRRALPCGRRMDGARIVFTFGEGKS
jgi:hypothetical protein